MDLYFSSTKWLHNKDGIALLMFSLVRKYSHTLKKKWLGLLFACQKKRGLETKALLKIEYNLLFKSPMDIVLKQCLSVG